MPGQNAISAASEVPRCPVSPAEEASIPRARKPRTTAFGMCSSVRKLGLATQRAELLVPQGRVRPRSASAKARSTRAESPPTPRIAKVFMTNRSQAVRLPKEYQFSTSEVFIRKKGEEVELVSRSIAVAPYKDTAASGPPEHASCDRSRNSGWPGPPKIDRRPRPVASWRHFDQDAQAPTLRTRPAGSKSFESGDDRINGHDDLVDVGERDIDATSPGSRPSLDCGTQSDPAFGVANRPFTSLASTGITMPPVLPRTARPVRRDQPAWATASSPGAAAAFLRRGPECHLWCNRAPSTHSARPGGS